MVSQIPNIPIYIRLLEYIPKFFSWGCGKLREIIVMFRSIRYWKSSEALWAISRYGEISIEDNKNGGYFITIPVTIKYSNKDERFGINIIPHPILKLNHTGSGREGKYYRLITHDIGVKYIPAKDSKEITHTFSTTIWAYPLISENAKCKIIGKLIGSRNLPIGVVKGGFQPSSDNKFIARCNVNNGKNKEN